MAESGITLRVRTLVVSVLLAGLVGAGTRGLLTASPVRRTRPEVGTAARLAATQRDGRGAVRAATIYVRAGQRIFELPASERAGALRGFAASSAADGYVAAQTRQLAELDGIAQRGQGPLTWHVAVLATRIDAFTAHRARVEIWRLGVLSIEGLTAPIAEFTTVTYELVWEAGAWRIWSEAQVPGPSPMPHPEALPSTPKEWRTRLDGFDRYPGDEPV
ncbi:MAG: hypothetical protein WD598_08105 [Acidimicrobiia bacterium]